MEKKVMLITGATSGIGRALDVKEVISCFEFALSRSRGANIRDLVILPSNQHL